MDSSFGFGVLLLVAAGLLYAARRLAPSLARRLAPAVAAFHSGRSHAVLPPPRDEQVQAIPDGITLTSARLSWQDRLTGVLGLVVFVSFGAVALAATVYLLAAMLAHLVAGTSPSSG